MLSHPVNGGEASRMPDRPRQTLLTVAKALTVLRSFTTERRWIGVRELSRELGLNGATVQSILTTLAGDGLVEQNAETKKYQLGLGLVEMAGTKLAQLDLVTVAMPFLNRLMHESGETVNLAVIYGSRVLYLAKVESRQPIRAASRIGGHAPLHCSAHGKALLAFAPPPFVDEMLAGDLEHYTSATDTNPASIREELADIRRKEYATDLGGYIEYLNAVAAPVRDHSGKVIASIGFVAPSQRAAPGDLNAKAPMVLRTSEEISSALGWSPGATPLIG
jgi:IclR family transcriptional regulator, KDG regulon repressor